MKLSHPTPTTKTWKNADRGRGSESEFDALPMNIQKSILNNLEGWGFRNPAKTARTKDFLQRLARFAKETGEPNQVSLREARRAVDAHAHARNAKASRVEDGGDLRGAAKERTYNKYGNADRRGEYVASAIGLVRKKRTWLDVKLAGRGSKE